MKRFYLAAVLAVSLIILATVALAHHGWSWTTGGNVEIFGIIKTAKLGNPHGVLEVDAEGDTWTVEVGQPWRNQRAGLKDGDLAPGVEVRIIGEPSANINDRLAKAERVFIGTKEYILYPDRN